MKSTLNLLSAASVSLGGEDQIPERNPRELLANAVRVSATDVPIANAIRTDEQRRAVWAKMGGGGGGGKSWARPAMQAMVDIAPSAGGKSYSWNDALPAGLADAQAQNAQWIGSQLAAGRTVAPAGGGQITAEGTWTPQGGFVPHSPEVLQAMATTRAQIAFNKQLEQRMFERASTGFNREMAGIGGTRPALDVMPHDPGSMVYAGGSPNFDERTGRYVDQPEPQYTTMPIRKPSGSRAGQSAASRPQYNKQTGQMEYPAGRITTKPTPSRPIKTQNSLARALQRYE